MSPVVSIELEVEVPTTSVAVDVLFPGIKSGIQNFFYGNGLSDIQVIL